MNHNHDKCQDDKIVELLSQLKTDVVLCDDFEQKFLDEMHRRRSAEDASKNKYKSVWDTIQDYFANVSGTKWAYGLSTAATAAIVVGIIFSDSIPSIPNGASQTATLPEDAGLQHVKHEDNMLFNENSEKQPDQEKVKTDEEAGR